jgi:hypothetical protein
MRCPGGSRPFHPSAPDAQDRARDRPSAGQDASRFDTRLTCPATYVAMLDRGSSPSAATGAVGGAIEGGLRMTTVPELYLTADQTGQQQTTRLRAKSLVTRLLRSRVV